MTHDLCLFLSTSGENSSRCVAMLRLLIFISRCRVEGSQGWYFADLFRAGPEAAERAAARFPGARFSKGGTASYSEFCKFVS